MAFFDRKKPFKAKKKQVARVGEAGRRRAAAPSPYPRKGKSRYGSSRTSSGGPGRFPEVRIGYRY